MPKKLPAEHLIQSLMNDLKDVADNAKSDSVPAHDQSRTVDIYPKAQKKQADDTTAVIPGTRSSVSVGASHRSSGKSAGQQANPGIDAQLQQAETLRLAQQRISEIEKLLDKTRQENEELSSVVDVARSRAEDLQHQLLRLEKNKNDMRDQLQAEIGIHKDNLQSKDFELSKMKLKVEELDSRLQSDLKKVRVRERDLENRLELSKVEKNALVKSKDETILDLKRKMDYLNSEVENYKNRIVELNQKLESNQEQFGRTVRALRLALTNLESAENKDSMTLAPLKKAE